MYAFKCTCVRACVCAYVPVACETWGWGSKACVMGEIIPVSHPLTIGGKGEGGGRRENGGEEGEGTKQSLEKIRREKARRGVMKGRKVRGEKGRHKDRKERESKNEEEGVGRI